MKELVLGSLNIDCTYRVHEFVRPKESLSVKGYTRTCGGKGFNQAVALARAGGNPYFAGVIGPDGGMLQDALAAEKIHMEFLRHGNRPTGHAVIQVNDRGENCILYAAGANEEVDKEYIREVLSHFGPGDLIILQNEIPHVDYAIRQAKASGMIVAWNPSPFPENPDACKVEQVDYLFLNETEGNALTGEEEPERILQGIRDSSPGVSVVLTLGEAGSRFLSAGGEITACAAFPCQAVDPTAAGDTFAGYFLVEYLRTRRPQEALRIASAASSLSVSRAGAAQSIPARAEVEAFLRNH